MRCLYVSQNGMAENLGQSQVLPYLRGLARHGIEIELVSYELNTLAPTAKDEIAHELSRDGISWRALERTPATPLRTKLFEAAVGSSAVIGIAMRSRPDILHGRSYFASSICDAAARVVPKAKVLFDCRGMIGDEYIDCGHWTKDRIEYRMVKAYERRLFGRSAGVVVLTRALASWLRERGMIGRSTNLEVIPCCVDLGKFKASAAERIRIRRELGLEDAFTLVYSGSLGTWYLEPEMAEFANAVRELLRKRGRRTAFLCLTPSAAASLRRHLEGGGFPSTDIITMRVKPASMPSYLNAGDCGLSFIQSCFSKKGSSPTKVAEYLACGNIAVVNGDIGDQADLAVEAHSCVVLPSFASADIAMAAQRAATIADVPFDRRVVATVDTARRHFGLEEVGVARYIRLYEALASV